MTISNRWASSIVQCYGITQDPSNNDYMLVMSEMDINLKNYLKQNYNKLTWKEKIQVTYDIVLALSFIYDENAIHRDLHSGNILYLNYHNNWYISDLGFCGPANKPLGSIYGNLPYIAPEVIAGKEYTYASDIYSIGILMWEISTGQQPFGNLNHDYDLAMNIINGIRPKIGIEIPLEYKKLMEQCWDADPEERPDIVSVLNKIKEIRKPYYQHENEEQAIDDNIISSRLNADFSTSSSSINSLIRRILSKIHIFEGLPEPRNATEGTILKCNLLHL
jgi:serine/threonine protein kinase